MRKRGLYTVCVADIRSFFDTIPWRHLDRVIGKLEADDAIKALLRAAVRIETRDIRTGKRMERRAGTPQGIAISPVLSNLVLSGLDKRLQQAVGPYGGVVIRYADDYLLATERGGQCETVRNVLVGGLGELGLTLKSGTGNVVDLREADRNVRWLGVRMVCDHGILTTSVPEVTIEAKAHEIRAKLEAGTLSEESVRESLVALYRYFTCVTRKEEAQKAVDEIAWRIGSTEQARKAG